MSRNTDPSNNILQIIGPNSPNHRTELELPQHVLSIRTHIQKFQPYTTSKLEIIGETREQQPTVIVHHNIHTHTHIPTTVRSRSHTFYILRTMPTLIPKLY